MQKFAEDTRHKGHQLVTDNDLEHVTRKFLCTQLPKNLGVSWEEVYPYVSSDYSSIEFRAPGVMNRYANYVSVPEDEFSYLDCEENLKIAHSEIPEIFEDFLKHVRPPVGCELHAFFAQSRNTNLWDHINTMVKTKSERERLYHDFKNYHGPPPAMVKPDKLGDFINKIECGVNKKKKKKNDKEIEREPLREDVSSKKKASSNIKHIDGQEWTNEEEQNSWRNAILNAFKVKNHLPTHFDSRKAIKQCLLSKHTSVDELRHLMGKYQNEIVDVDNGIEELVYIIDYYPQEILSKVMEIPLAQKFYRKHQPENSRECVKQMILAGELNDEIIDLLKK